MLRIGFLDCKSFCIITLDIKPDTEKPQSSEGPTEAVKSEAQYISSEPVYSKEGDRGQDETVDRDGEEDEQEAEGMELSEHEDGDGKTVNEQHSSEEVASNLSSEVQVRIITIA